MEQSRAPSVNVLKRMYHTVTNRSNDVFASWHDHTGGVQEQYTFSELWTTAGKVAHDIRFKYGAQKGDRVILCFDFGLQFFATFLGCLRAGVIAVPVYPPNPATLQKSLEKLSIIVASCKPTLLLMSKNVKLLKAGTKMKNAISSQKARWPTGVRYECSRQIRKDSQGSEFDEPTITEDDIAFLQYTSGSTSDPKGVIVCFSNIYDNVNYIIRMFQSQFLRLADDFPDGVPSRMVGVSWLPTYHDMGLILATIMPFTDGHRMYYMAPTTFIRTPTLWVRLMSQHRAHWTPAPDFAYALCTRKWLADHPTAPSDLQAAKQILDLSSMRVMVTGAEPIRRKTMEDFDQTFGAYGLHPKWPNPCYGLAESVVFVSVYHAPDDTFLTLSSTREGLVCCGDTLSDYSINGEARVVDPDTGRECPDGVEGELWLSSPSCCRGYYGLEELSRESFNVPLVEGIWSDDSPSHNGFLRTGDMAILEDGKLFICGRRKDLIIINGKNYYPQDLELATQDAWDGVRPGCVAAFSETELGGAVIIVFEVREGPESKDMDILRRMLSRVAVHVGVETGVRPDRVVVIKERSIPKTTSGKIQRRKTRTCLKDGVLQIILDFSFSKSAAEGASPETDINQLRAGAAEVAATASAILRASGENAFRVSGESDLHPVHHKDTMPETSWATAINNLKDTHNSQPAVEMQVPPPAEDLGSISFVVPSIPGVSIESDDKENNMTQLAKQRSFNSGKVYLSLNGPDEPEAPAKPENRNSWTANRRSGNMSEVVVRTASNDDDDDVGERLKRFPFANALWRQGSNDSRGGSSVTQPASSVLSPASTTTSISNSRPAAAPGGLAVDKSQAMRERRPSRPLVLPITRQGSLKSTQPSKLTLGLPVPMGGGLTRGLSNAFTPRLTDRPKMPANQLQLTRPHAKDMSSNAVANAITSLSKILRASNTIGAESPTASRRTNDLLHSAVNSGLSGMFVGTEFTGMGLGAGDFTTAMEFAGMHDVAFATQLGYSQAFAQGALVSGFSALRNKHMPVLCLGSFVSVGVLEEGGGGFEPSSPVSTLAEECQGGFKINGHKTLVFTGSPDTKPELLIVFGRVEMQDDDVVVTQQPGLTDHTAKLGGFVVSPTAEGVTIEPSEVPGFVNVDLTGVVVSKSSMLIADSERYHMVLGDVLSMGRLQLLGVVLGCMKRVFDLALKFVVASNAVQTWGKSLTEMLCRIHTLSSVSRAISSRLDNNLPVPHTIFMVGHVLGLPWCLSAIDMLSQLLATYAFSGNPELAAMSKAVHRMNMLIGPALAAQRMLSRSLQRDTNTFDFVDSALGAHNILKTLRTLSSPSFVDKDPVHAGRAIALAVALACVQTFPNVTVSHGSDPSKYTAQHIKSELDAAMFVERPTQSVTTLPHQHMLAVVQGWVASFPPNSIIPHSLEARRWFPVLARSGTSLSAAAAAIALEADDVATPFERNQSKRSLNRSSSRLQPVPMEVNISITDEGEGNAVMSAAEFTKIVLKEAATLVDPEFTLTEETAFHDVGFDSIKGGELISRLQKIPCLSQLNLPDTLLFDCPTPSAIAIYLRATLLNGGVAVTAASDSDDDNDDLDDDDDDDDGDGDNNNNQNNNQSSSSLAQGYSIATATTGSGAVALLPSVQDTPKAKLPSLLSPKPKAAAPKGAVNPSTVKDLPPHGKPMGINVDKIDPCRQNHHMLSPQVMLFLQTIGALLVLVCLSLPLIPAYQFGIRVQYEVRLNDQGVVEVVRDNAPWTHIKIRDDLYGYGLLIPLVIPIWMLGYTLVVLIAKWIVIGRYKEGEVPLNSLYHLRWWFVDRLITQWENWVGVFVSDTILVNLFYKLMGCHVSLNCSIYTFIREFDLVTLGTACSVSGRIFARTFQPHKMRLAPVSIGAHCSLGSFSVIMPGATMCEGSTLTELAVLPQNATAKAFTNYSGNPAQPLGHSAGTKPPRGLFFQSLKISILTPILYALFLLSNACVMFWDAVSLPKFRYSALLFWLASYFIVVHLQVVLSIILKWVFVGRVKPGVFKPTAWRELRDWSVDYVARICKTQYFVFFEQIGLCSVIGRLYGMGIEKDVFFTYFPGLLKPSRADLFHVHATSVVSVASVDYDVDAPQNHKERLPLHIGSNAFIGFAVSFAPGTIIPDKASVGTMTPVTGQVVEPGKVLFGNPPQKLTRQMQTAAIEKLCKKTFFEHCVIYFCRWVMVFLMCLCAIPSYELCVWLLYNDPDFYYNNNWALGISQPPIDRTIAMCLMIPSILPALFALLLLLLFYQWLVMGDFRHNATRFPDEYPSYQSYNYIIFHRLISPFVTGSQWLNRLLNFLGARVHPTAYLIDSSFYEMPLLSIGEETVIDSCQITGHKVDDGGMTFGLCGVGKRCCVQPGGFMWWGDILPDGCTLGARSKLLGGNMKHQFPMLCGVPARSMMVASASQL